MYEVLAAALGFSFESYAVACMGALYKAMVITVQVCARLAGLQGADQPEGEQFQTLQQRLAQLCPCA